MIYLIDNYDSFSYNLYQMLGALCLERGLGADAIRVVRNDALSVSELAQARPDAVLLSPGPGSPADAGICVDVVRELSGSLPILGVCLGHQAICAAFGATVTYARRLMHGKQSDAKLDTGCPLFAGLPDTVPVARYHSLAADPATLLDCLKAAAMTPEGELMAVQHAEHPTFGVQFHPESILTPDGKRMLRNFIEL
jgi:anthranilate synthase component 2